MKLLKQLLLIFSFFTIPVIGQQINSINLQNVSDEYADRTGYIFQHIEKNRIPHGILLDQSIHYIDISYFSGANVLFNRR